MIYTIQKLLFIAAIFLGGALFNFASAQDKTCPEFTKKALMPADLENALYQVGNSAYYGLNTMICDGFKNGVRIRYLRSGLFRNEGIEIKGKIVVKFYFERKKILSSGQTLIIPTDANVEGEDSVVDARNINSFNTAVMIALAGDKI